MKGIIEQGQEEGIFQNDIDSEAAALVVYNTIVLLLSHDPNQFRRKNKAPYHLDIDTLLRILGQGLMAPD